MSRPLLCAFLIAATVLGVSSRAEATLQEPGPIKNATFYKGETGRTYEFATGTSTAIPYQIQIGQNTVDVYFTADMSDETVKRLLRFTAHAYNLIPPVHRHAVTTVEFTSGPLKLTQRQINVGKRMGPKAYVPGYANHSTISFIRVRDKKLDGGYDLQFDVFLHEAGHCVANALFGTTDPPEQWTQAAIQDRHTVSDYSYAAYTEGTNFAEDFADAYSAFILNFRRPPKSSFYYGADAVETNVRAHFPTLFPSRAYILSYITGVPLPGGGSTKVSKTSDEDATFNYAPEKASKPQRSIPKPKAKPKTKAKDQFPQLPPMVF